MTDRQLPEAVRRAHDEAEANGDPGYLDPATGYFVFTRARLLANGRRCRNGCRHCPFGPGNPSLQQETR